MKKGNVAGSVNWRVSTTADRHLRMSFWRGVEKKRETRGQLFREEREREREAADRKKVTHEKNTKHKEAFTQTERGRAREREGEET